MRKFLIFIVIILAGCGGNGNGPEVTPEPVQHVPTISDLQLSPDGAVYMEGNGSVQVTAEFAFTDIGRDIETLHVKMSNGTSLAISIGASVDTVSGTFAKVLDMTTADADRCMIEIWLVDKAGQSSNHLAAPFSVIRHTPEISNVSLSPDSSPHMQGDGSVAVSAEISFKDAGLDIKTLWVSRPDGTSIEFDKSSATETGTFNVDFTMSTETAGTYAVEFWLLDDAADSSDHFTAVFTVVGDTQSSDWTSRLSGLPYALNDVIWNRSVFVAVGDSGAILTSTDGVNWITRESGTDVRLNSVAAYGSEIFAVGDETMLLSTDHGATWSTHDTSLIAAELTAVVVTSSQLVISGFSYGLAAGFTSMSEDRGDTWQFGNFWCATDLTYQNNLFVGALIPYLGYDRAWVMVSSDGETWNEIVVREGGPALFTVTHDGSQFIVAGSDGAVFASFDGFNWTKLQTPVAGVNYLGAAWSGSKLVIAGGSDSPSERPMGIASTDGGVSWDLFNIDGNYQSLGMAFGNGRFVSVGHMPLSGEGAIYTTD